MITKDKMANLVFIDIETVAQKENYEQLEVDGQELWQKKASWMVHDSTQLIEEVYNEKAGIYAEFGKIVTIGIGYFVMEEGLELRVKALYDENEGKLLREFKSLICDKFEEEKIVFCAHNGKEFDYPYLCRRMLANKITLPKSLNMMGKKPWEIKHLDTMEMWKFGDRKNYTSLDLLAYLFGINSSKSDMDGSMVNKVFYQEKNLRRIAKYCKKDVVVTAQVYLNLMSEQMLSNEKITLLE